MSISMQTLMLTPWMAPHRIISWQRAVVLRFLGKVEVLEEYDDTICSPSVVLKTPAVVRLVSSRSVVKDKRVRFSRINVYLRDGFRCQYCGEKKKMSDLNYDHVVPRVKGGRTEWENIVTSCYGCNDRKGSRTPEEARMKLLRVPARPRSLPMPPALLDCTELPEIWQAYCAGA
jgi:5-methylcytosine-specific restriction endonuclease McrA